MPDAGQRILQPAADGRSSTISQAENHDAGKRTAPHRHEFPEIQIERQYDPVFPQREFDYFRIGKTLKVSVPQVGDVVAQNSQIVDYEEGHSHVREKSHVPTPRT